MFNMFILNMRQIFFFAGCFVYIKNPMEVFSKNSKKNNIPSLFFKKFHKIP